MKPGSCAVTTTGAEPNFTAVACNGAAGSVTTNANVTIAAVGGKRMDPESRRAWRGFTASPDGTRIAVTLDSGFGRQPLRDRIALFDAQTGKLLHRWSDSGESFSNYEQLCFSHDGQLLASSDKDALHLWEAATGTEVLQRKDLANALYPRWSPDGRVLALSRHDNRSVVLLDLGTEVLIETDNDAFSGVWAPDGN